MKQILKALVFLHFAIGQFYNLDEEFRKLNKIRKPKCLIVNSIKGKGFKIMENKTHSHYWSPITKDRYIKSLKELREEYE